MKKRLIVITGPTASGKTKLSIQLAKKINAEIICADSRIVYKDLDIVSAKPTVEEQDGIPHHLINIKTPDEDFSAGDFVKLSSGLIDKIYSENKNVIICGGTWFYIKSLLDDVKLPKCEINQEYRNKLNKLDSATLWEKLEKLDSKRAQLIHPNNKDKIIRSLELIKFLNIPISEYQREENDTYEANWYMLNFDRETIYERINLRVDEMIKQGLFKEWQENNKKYGKTNIIYNTIGYREFYDLEEKIYPDTISAIEKIKQHTRNFAKRQLTYFKSNDKIKLINSAEEIIEDINV